ncbi:MAG: PPC domain-containing protein [Leptolyngbyaceae cyanobacterium]
MRSITSLFGVLGTILATSLTITTSYASTIHQGTLELGDAIFFYDGSLYDDLPIRGKAGQTVKIELRSYDFDPFLAIVGPQGEWLAHNNDIDPNNSHSALSFTFPSDGTYYIFVNTYRVSGQGSYVLELASLTASSPDQDSDNPLLLPDSPPMPTPILIQPSSHWPSSGETEEDGGDRIIPLSQHQPNNLNGIDPNLSPSPRRAITLD